VSHTSERSLFKDWFEWRWVGIGFLLCLGLNLIAFWAVRPTLIRLLYKEERVLTGAAMLGAITLGLCFLCGVTVGRLSLRRAVREPAVASVLAILAMSLLQLRLGMVNAAGVILGAPLCFGTAYLGGRLGWIWRKRHLAREYHVD
jgi:hypothetical protein